VFQNWNKISLSRYYCKNALESFGVLQGLDLTPRENKNQQKTAQKFNSPTQESLVEAELK